MSVPDYKINYKSDFVLNINGDAGWAVPFCIKFWTGAPVQAYFVGFDGVKYVNCRVGDTPTQLLVMFDDHHLPIGKLKMQIAYHTTIAEFPGSVFDEVTNARDVIVTIDGTDYQVLLDFTGETAPELEFDLPAYANEAERIQNELQRQQNEAARIEAELEREQTSAAAVAGAENVNAQLNGNILTVTNRNGVSTSVNTKGEQGEQGPVGPEGPQGETGVSIVSFTQKSETTTALIYTVTFSDGTTQDVAIPKGPKGDTGATGPTGPQGPQGQTGVSITGFVETGETETATLYNITFSNGTTQAVAIPKGEKGDQGPQGPVGPQGPMGDVAVITPEQQAAFTMYSVPGQNTDGPMTQKAVTDALVAGSISYDNSQSSLISDNVQDAIDKLSTQALPFEETAFVTASTSGKWINNLSGSWETKSNTAYCLFNVYEGEVYKIHATSNGNSHVAFLTDNTTTGSAHFVSGTGVTLIPPSTSRKFEVPSGANYIYILVVYNNSYRTEKVERVNGILERVEELSENTMLGFADKIIVKSGLLDILDGKSISAYTTRAITENYLPPQTLVTCNEGYYMRGIYRYTKNGEDFIFQDYQNWATTPYSSIKPSNYYFRVLFQKGDGSEVVNSSDVIKSVQYGVEQLAGTELPTNVELGAYEISSPNFNPSKYNYPHRMSTGGLFSNAGAITVVCKDGYEANIAYYTRGVAVRYYGWKKEHIGVTQDYSEFAVFFRRADNGNVSDSDLDCVGTFKYDNIIGENLLDKAVAPAVGYQDFTVSVDTGVADTVSETLALQDSQVFENDKGRIYLPATYSQYGKPTRLIIHCHGASQNYNNGTVFPASSMHITLDYLLAKGYAVMDVNGMPGTHNFFATTSGNPVALRSYIKAYDWVMNNFNLYKEIFVVGISAGSIPALQISNLDIIPVLASATYCGIMDFSRAWMLLGGYHPDNQGPAIKSYLADKYAFVGTRPTFGNADPCSDEEWKYIVDNIKQFEGWNTFTMGITSTMTREQYREIVSVVYGSTVPSWIPADYSFDSVQQMLLAFKIPQRGNLSSYQIMIAQEKKLFDTCAIQRQVPIKLFHAVNDDTAPYRYSQYYYEMCKRGGSIAEFRTFPSGGHAPKGNTITQDGISTNVLTVELLDFLQRFE